MREFFDVLSVVSPIVVILGALFWARRVERRLETARRVLNAHEQRLDEQERELLSLRAVRDVD